MAMRCGCCVKRLLDNVGMSSRTASFSALAPTAAGVGSESASAASGQGRSWGAALAALFIWLAVGMLLGYGGLQGWGRRELHPPAPVTPPAPVVVDSVVVGRVLGANAAANAAVVAEPVAATVPTRYTLSGVMAVGRDGQTGVALIATDGQKPKPYRVGATVDGRWAVESVSVRAVVLRPLPSVVHSQTQGPMTLQLPTPPAVSLTGGTWSSPSGPSGASAATPPVAAAPGMTGLQTPTQ